MNDIESPGERNFLGLSKRYSSRDSSYFCVIPVPYDATSSFLPGSRFGPRAVIDASANLELYDHELDIECARVGIATEPEVEPVVGDPTGMITKVEDVVSNAVSRSALPVVLGGDHTVSLGALQALSKRTDLSLVSLDAHADLRDSYQSSRYSHACYLRRALEIVKSCRVFGVRSLSRVEKEFGDRSSVQIDYAHELKRAGISSIDVSGIPREIYLSVDVDVLDPSIMPATGTPEPGGLDWYELIDLIEAIIRGRRVVGFDVVELAPQQGNFAPNLIAAKLVYKIMGLIVKYSVNREELKLNHG